MAEVIGEPWRTLLSAGFGMGLLTILTKIVERRVPSREGESMGEREFRAHLLARVLKLEEDRDKLNREADDHDKRYWELFTSHSHLQHDYELLKAEYARLQIVCTDLQQRLDLLTHPPRAVEGA